MALLFMDGFEGNDIAAKWDASSSGSTATTTPRFAFTGSRRVTGASLTKTVTGTAKLTLSFGFNPTSGGGTEVVATINSNGGATTQLTLQYSQTTGLFTLKRGSTVLATSSIVLTATNWYYIEFQCTIDPTTGTGKLKVNGTLDINFTGNTQNTSPYTVVDQVIFAVTGSSFDDLVISDGTGSHNNDFLGEVRVYPIIPTGAGISTQFTPSSGSNWSNVAGPAVQSTNINSDATSGHKDDFAMGDLPSPVTGAYSVLGVQANAYASKSDAGAASFKNELYVGTTHYQSGSHVLSTSYLTYHDIWETNPDTAANWTVSDVNGAQAGYAVV